MWIYYQVWNNVKESHSFPISNSSIVSMNISLTNSLKEKLEEHIKISCPVVKKNDQRLLTN